jgi:prevent-host-death family protein
MAESVNVHYAKTHLSALLKRVREGATIIIANAGQPVARLVPVQYGQPRTPGGIVFEVDKKFFEPLPNDELEAWEG